MTTGYNAGLDSSDLKISYATETVWATIPSVVFKQLRVTAEDFTEEKTRVRPLEINPSGYAQHAITTQVASKGSINFGLSFGTFDDFILGSLNAAAWSDMGHLVNTGSTDLQIVSSGSILESATTARFTTAPFILNPGDHVTLSGYTNAANNGDFTVNTVGSGATPQVVLYNLGTTTLATLVNESPTTGTVTLSRRSISSTAGDITLTNGTNILSSTTSGKFSNLVKGQWIRLSGFANAANNGVFLINAVTGGIGESLTLQNATNTQVFVTETPALAATKVFASYIQNGAAVTTFSVEKQLAAALFLRYVGAYVSSLQLTMEVGKFVEGVINFLVKSEASSTTEAGTSAPTAAPTARIIDNIGGFSAFAVNGAAPTAVLQAVDLTVSKQRSASQYGIGSASSVGMRRGTLQVDGKLSLFFLDFTYYNDFVTEPDLRLSWQLTDNLGQAYVVTLCAATIMNPSIVAKGIDQDIIADFTLEGNPAQSTDSLYPGVTIQIDRLLVL